MPTGLFVKLNLGFARNSASLLSNCSHFSPRRYLSSYSMAASSSKAVFGNGDVYFDDMVTTCGNGLEGSKPSSVFFVDRSRASCGKVGMRMRNRQVSDSRLVCGYSSFDAIRRSGSSDSFVVAPLSRNLYTLCSMQLSVKAARDVSFDGVSREEQLTNSTMVSGQTLKLVSGSCYMPHPDKEATGGEDAHFICEEQQIIGVADGVGGWAEVGVNAGEYSRELMSNSVSAIKDEPEGSIDPARVLEKAHSRTKAQGSSTACIIALTDEGIHAINLGDSGFMVVRDGWTVFQSPVQQHGFNFTFQLENSGNSDLPSSGQVFTFPVSPGDVVIAGTDGLFDNLYKNEVSTAVVHALKDGLGPQATAQKIAALARQRALDKNRQSPFSAAAQEAGYRYYGGKLDDITVIVSFITSS
ncbi:probable protein phosphatase 2C 55 [Mercurialis annua]|uniref:probable protein phosphatase 2C 55 n=1 Tax=Mercurialis annua TaxID=3986 RepID=UPI00215F4C77|nr:probable protein phosphatase 2C 55 [Mercurialis annua]